MAKTTLEEVRKRMKDLKENKANELAAIRKGQEAAAAQLEEAESAAKDATRRMDVEAYELAKIRAGKAQTALELYAAKQEEISKQEYISESESDAVIDSLLEYEKELEAILAEQIAEPLRTLAVILDTYKSEIAETERTINQWCAEIHQNYTTRGRTKWTDRVTGEVTDRSPKPVPVRIGRYEGCPASAALDDLFSRDVIKKLSGYKQSASPHLSAMFSNSRFNVIK